MKRILLILSAIMLALGCQNDDQIQGKSDFSLNFLGFQQQRQVSANVITITDTEDHPITNAQVLIGYALNDPYPDNFYTSDAQGQIQVPEIFEGLPLTISAEGHIRATFFAQNAGTHTYQVRKVENSLMIELGGTTTNFGSLPKDGYADFGMVIPALTRQDIFAFDMSLILSPEMDKFEVAGQEVEVSSNITFPRQKENYFIPITLDKEPYRIYFNSTGVKKVYAINGQFHFKTVIGKVRNGQDFAGMINDFTYKSATVRDLNITQNTRMDIPINENIFGNPIQITTPQFSNDQVVVALVVSDDNGYLLPSDLKRVDPSKTVSLKTSNLGTKYLALVQKPSADFYAATPRNGPISAVLVPLTKGNAPQPLELFDLPNVTTDSWTASTVKNKGGVNELATYAVLSNIVKVGGKETKIKKWETYAPTWLSKMKLPQFPGDVPEQTRQRWEVSFLGNQNSALVKFGPGILSSATHVSFNVKDF